MDTSKLTINQKKRFIRTAKQKGYWRAVNEVFGELVLCYTDQHGDIREHGSDRLVDEEEQRHRTCVELSQSDLEL